MIRCKICDVRDYETARLCSELGADYLGLHGIKGIKEERRNALVQIASQIPREFPNVGIVLVTLVTDHDLICSMLSDIGPSHIQLHSSEWRGATIQQLRERIKKTGLQMPKIVGVVDATTTDSAKRAQDMHGSVDMLLFDITHYSSERPLPLPPESYRSALECTAGSEVPTLIAGGLDCENITEFLSIVRPWGVDVQRGVETNKKKDETKLRRFLASVKGFES